MYARFARKIGYPLLDVVRGRHMMGRYDELLHNEVASASVLREMEMARLAALVRHASKTSPYYEDRYRGHDTDDVSTSKALSRLPVLRKSDLQEHLGDIISGEADRSRLVAGRTGGSTGEPTRFFHDRTSLDYIRAATLRNARWAGYEVGAKVVRVTGSHFDYGRTKQFQTRLTALLLRQRWMPAIDLSDQAIDRSLRELRRWRPSFLWGYASAIAAVAERAEATGAGLQLRGVLTSSDTLTASMRAVIEQAFRCRVFDTYGSREISIIAAECEEHEGYHINSDVVHVEVVDGDGRRTTSGESGRILITDLWNYGFPLIRYEIGDVGTMADDPCRCGRPFPRLKSLEGRLYDYIVRADGARIAPPAFTVLMSDLPSLRQYQIHQNADASVEVRIVPRGPWTASDEHHLRRGMDAILGPGVRYSIELSDRIDRGKSGKSRPVTSEASGGKTRGL